MNTVGIVDVAQAAGVSIGTVSNVLNHPERVSESTRARVRDAIEQLGYVRHEAARHLRSGTSDTIGLVVLDVRNPFFTDLSSGAEEAAERSGGVVLLCHTGHDVAREDRQLDMLQRLRVRGVVIAPVDARRQRLRRLVESGIPAVLVDVPRPDGSWCSVGVDDAVGGRLALEHVADLGHRRVAVVGDPDTTVQVRSRVRGIREAAGPRGVTVTTVPASLDTSGGRAAGDRLAGLPAAERPTAVLAANDLVALGVLQACVGAGLRVPGDLSIVGYDDIDFAAAAAVPLTSVRQPREELGRVAVELLLDEAGRPDDHRHRALTFTPELVARDSTGPPRD